MDPGFLGISLLGEWDFATLDSEHRFAESITLNENYEAPYTILIPKRYNESDWV